MASPRGRLAHVRQRDPRIVLSDPAAYVREGNDLGSAHRLASRHREASRLWPVEPAYVSGVRAAVWFGKAQAAAVASEQVDAADHQRPAAALPRLGQPGGGANARGKTGASEGRLHNVVTRVLTR